MCPKQTGGSPNADEVPTAFPVVSLSSKVKRMSLVGSLEDLGLGEIMQIVSLSGKSGVLWIRSNHGEGHVLFRRGLIRGAFVKDGPRDLRDLVASAGVLPADQVAALDAAARAESVPLEALLCARTSLDAGCIDELRGRYVEETVLRMFGWPSGEFSFEIRDEPGGGEIAEDLLLRTGLNAQFLALEGTRMRDEGGVEAPEIGGASAAAAEDDETSFADFDDDEEASDDPFRSRARVDVATAGVLEAELEPATDDDTDAPLLATTAEDDTAVGFEAIPAVEPEPHDVEEPPALQISVLDLVDDEVDGEELPALLPAADDEGEAGAESADEETTLSAATPGDLARPAELLVPAAPTAGTTRPGAGPLAVVVVDPELAVLEWVKRALAPLPVRAHIFQRSEQAIARIRQYLVRGDVPLVLLSTATPPDPVSGAKDWAEIAARLRAQVPNVPLVLLAAPGVTVSPVNERAIPDALSARPDLTMLSDERARDRRETLAVELRGALERAHAKAAPRGPLAPPRQESADALRNLREVSARLRDPASRGDVLRLLLEYAGSVFDRVAIFAIREGEAFGVAQVGLPGAGGPDDEDLRKIRFPSDEPAWCRNVLTTRAPLRAALEDDGDRDLASRLGSTAPSELYAAPIESGERIAAVLYADNLGSRRPLGDTSALEVVLHEAGLALERAVLERALAQAEGERPATEPKPF